MAEMKPTAQSYATPTTSSTPGSGEPYMVVTPLWCTVVRGFQIFISFLIVVLAGLLIHGYAMDANVFALVCGMMTWVVCTYALVSEKVPSANGAYNIWAVLALDLLMAIFWLSSMGANAALRASFVYDVTVDGCYNDGSAVSSNHCIVSRRGIEKRAAVASAAGLAEISAIAGLSALEMLLFIAVLVYNGHTFRMHHANRTAAAAVNPANVEMKAQETPMLSSSAQPAVVGPVYPQYTDQQAYQQQQYGQQQTGYPPQQQQSPAPVSTPSPAPYQNTAGYVDPNTAQYQQQQQYQQQPYVQQQHQELQGAQAYGYQDPNAQYQQQQQQHYSPHGTPAQGQQPYHPPPQ
ncbi:hypothetical protein QBC46DRAFT_385378 [Diplogelasinospora grovesii]|uniref:MARVEL domain-containing protein n=1 Tax=Diplogelasinospora grovesii TaxID=303347 RepID=A0AAN6N781_9PEZI|nr:hypothetical protein QBC46DRAFT_385378 [Diplogelasinospora grovesii]